MHALRETVRSTMEAHWRPDGRGGGHTVPNADVYPHQWLWDSCFHALIWAELGQADRAIAELTAALADQADDGFVPHVRYVADPYGLAGFWGRSGTSSITQPPQLGHALVRGEGRAAHDGRAVRVRITGRQPRIRRRPRRLQRAGRVQRP